MLLSCLLALALAGEPALGHWRAALGPVDSEVPFDLVFSTADGALRAEVQNGAEHIAVPVVTWKSPELVLEFPHYDSRITARLADDGRSLAGEWKKRSGKDKWTTLEFRAQAGELPRFPPAHLPHFWISSFEITIAVGGSESHGALQIAQLDTGGVGASVRTPSGDLRYLAGSWDGTHLALSEFDGFFAFRFIGERKDSEIAGTCRMGAATGTWSGKSSSEAPAQGGFTAQAPLPRFPLAQLAYSDLDGVERALAEPLFEGHPLLISIGGSWCPNCHDEMQLLAELDAKYGPKGLSITELCFEYSGDFQRDALQARRMAERHGAKFRVLLGGTAGKGEPARAFPVLEAITAFPSALFVDRGGTIVALHTGFDGPATGAAHAAERAAFEKAIEALLASPAPSSSLTWNALLDGMWRDEREGWLGTFQRTGESGSFTAEELTRFDRPTREGIVAEGAVEVRGTLARIGGTLFRYDSGTGTFYDTSDELHRLVGGVRPHLPMIQGGLIAEADELEAALGARDPLLRAETRYHVVQAIRSRQAERDFEPWRGIDDADPRVACVAVWAAGELGRVDQAEAIAKLLADPYAPLRLAAVRALGKLAYEPAKPEFERLAAHDPDARVRALAKDPPKPPPRRGPPGSGNKH